MKLSQLPATAISIALFAASALAQLPDGSDINKAIPIYFGQEVTGVGDNVAGPVVYLIELARGQQIQYVASTTNSSGLEVYLLRSSAISVATLKDADYANGTPLCCSSAVNHEFTVPASGRYYLALRSASVGPYKLSVQSKGTPIVVPNPATAGCLKGRVESLTYSLQLIAVGLPDEMSIGGTSACTSCTVKAPGYPEITNRLEAALLSKINVEACYDASGNIFQVKLVQP